MKGALRSHTERRLWGWGVRVCDLFNKPNCGSQAQEHMEKNAQEYPHGPAIYAAACPACRCFGHIHLAGRWRFTDAPFMLGRDAAQVRDGVGINRRTGGSQANVLYRYEVLTRGAFATTLTLVNYELWQLGLLAYLLDDLATGHARLGGGTRRGLGRVTCQVTGMQWRFPAGLAAYSGQELRLRPLAPPRPDADYGLQDTPDAEIVVGPVAREGSGPLTTYTLRIGADVQPVEALWANAARYWLTVRSRFPASDADAQPGGTA